MSTPQPPVIRWHHPRWISYALVIAGVLAVMVGVADPSGNPEGRVPAESPAQLAQFRADANAGFPLPPHPDQPPRGPGA